MTGGELLLRYARPKTLAEACGMSDEAWVAIGGGIGQRETRAAVFPVPLTNQQKALQKAVAALQNNR